MHKRADKELDNEFKKIEKGNKKEQAMILANEANDEMQKRKMKMLMSKEFFELSKYLGGLHARQGMENMIAKKKIENDYEMKEEKARRELSGEDLE